MKTFFDIRPIFSALLRHKTGPLLVALQVAVSLAILANAIYIVNLRLAIAARPSGLADESSLFRVDISNQKPGGHQDSLALQRQEAATIRAVPGVVSVARTNSFPLSYNGSSSSVSVDRKQSTSTANPTYYSSADSLISTWGLKLIEGRDFQAGDIVEVDPAVKSETFKTVIISQELGLKLFPGQTRFVGKEFFLGTGEDAEAVRIVGVVERLQTQSGQRSVKAELTMLVPVRQSNNPYEGYAVRAAPGQRDRVMNAVEQALRRASVTPVHVKSKSMEEFRTRRYRADKGLAWMLLTVSALLVLITASGIVGMASLWVTQRRKQIGVRRALGARRLDILGYFVTENVLITSGGIAGGALLGIALNQLLVSQLEMSRLPPAYLLAGAALFWLLGVIAVYGPAWRAASISPALATRSA